MKKYLSAILMVLIFSLMFGASDVEAQGPSGDWTSSIFCVNQDANNDASVTFKFYKEDGSVIEFGPDIIGPNEEKYYYPSDLGSLGDFNGSLVVESSKGLSCSSQTSLSSVGTQSNPFMLGASGGFDISSASPTVFASQVLKNFDSGQFGFYNSYIAIQNTSSDAVTVTVEYTDRGLGKITAATKQYDINAQSGKIVYLEQNTNLPDGFLGSAKITANDGATPLVVQVVFYNDGSSYSKSQFLMYNGDYQGENKLYAPFVQRNFYDFNSGINIVNAGSTPTSFKIVFTIGRTSINTYTYQYPATLQPGRLVALFLPDIDALDPVDSLSMPERAGSAIIYATDINGNIGSGKLIANVNIRNDGRDPQNPNFGGQGSTYNAIGASQASKTLYVPNVQNMVGNAQFTSGINIANLTGTGGSCTYTFVDDPTVSWTKSLPANGIYSVLVSNITGLDAGYSSPVIINCTVDAAAIITLRANASSYWGDSQTSYNALKQIIIE